MTAELQRLVDALGERAERPVVLEDRRQRMIVYGRHDDPLDRVRTESILRRRTTSEVVAWFRRFGIASATEPVRTPAAPELGMLPRVCIPLRHHHLPLGHLLFVDADGSMTDEYAGTVQSALEQTARGLEQVERVVGIGRPRPTLERSGDSYEEARQAARSRSWCRRRGRSRCGRSWASTVRSHT